MNGRRLLPHEIPSWADPSAQTWFVTICCRTRGVAQLTTESNAGPLLDSVVYRHERLLWYAHIFLLMPDHCHALLSFPGDREVAQTIRDWKRWTARELRVEWQMDFFEHRLRREESSSQKWEYILQNPVRAGLVDQAEEWPHVWRAV